VFHQLTAPPTRARHGLRALRFPANEENSYSIRFSQVGTWLISRHHWYSTTKEAIARAATTLTTKATASTISVSIHSNWPVLCGEMGRSRERAGCHRGSNAEVAVALLRRNGAPPPLTAMLGKVLVQLDARLFASAVNPPGLVQGVDEGFDFVAGLSQLFNCVAKFARSGNVLIQ
jgi:hypothetical protein